MRSYALHPPSPLQAFKSVSTSQFQRLADMMSPVLDRLTQALHRSPDIVVLAFFLTMLFLTIQILNWARRVVMFWTRMALRLVFWSAIIALGAMVWQRGLEATARDMMTIGQQLIGYAAMVRDIWMREYQKYEAQERAGRAAGRSGAGYAASRGR
jgi:hypothetical protein